jgi:hypothetical protein
MPNVAPTIVTRSSSPAQNSVPLVECALIPWSTALPNSSGPTVSGSCQSTPTAVERAITRHWNLRNHRRNAAGVRVSGAGSGFSPAAL